MNIPEIQAWKDRIGPRIDLQGFPAIQYRQVAGSQIEPIYIPRNKISNARNYAFRHHPVIYFLVDHPEFEPWPKYALPNGIPIAHDWQRFLCFERPPVYIGKSMEGGLGRIGSHHNDKHFWNVAICFFLIDHPGKKHASRQARLMDSGLWEIEGYLKREATTCDWYEVKNIQDPSERELNGSELSEAIEFVAAIRAVLAADGFAILERPQRRQGVHDHPNKDAWYQKRRYLQSFTQEYQESAIIADSNVQLGEMVQDQTHSSFRSPPLTSNHGLIWNACTTGTALPKGGQALASKVKINKQESSIAKNEVLERETRQLTVAGLFAGIGGIELGLRQAGHQSRLLCEIEPGAQSVLRERFPHVELVGDVRSIHELPPVDILAGGFPCQDLSQAVRTNGITSENSGLINHMFHLLEGPSHCPKWLLMENVSSMLHLDGGKAMRYLADRLDMLGFNWAYRVLDTRAFGLPQRRQRVILLASRTKDPREILFFGNEPEPIIKHNSGLACGFYWTEGFRGLGWTIDAVPTLRVGTPSPPAIWMPDNRIITPDIRDAERLQGFPEDWTEPALRAGKKKWLRWNLVGNAVSVPVANWLGERLKDPQPYDSSRDVLICPGDRWPSAAWSKNGDAYRADLSMWPVVVPKPHLADFLIYDGAPLSPRATAGFLRRATSSNLRFAGGFLEAVQTHLSSMLEEPAAT